MKLFLLRASGEVKHLECEHNLPWERGEDLCKGRVRHSYLYCVAHYLEDQATDY